MKLVYRVAKMSSQVHALDCRKDVLKISANFSNCDEVYFQKRIISKSGECALKKNSATIFFLYCDINQFKTLKMPSPQARNQEFFRAGEFSSN